MSAIITHNFKIQNAINFANSLKNSNYYVTIGRVEDWDKGFDLVPTNTLNTYRSLWDNMIGGKAIQENRISLVIPKIEWVQGMIYAMYDDNDSDLYNKNFYVMTDDRNIYKCLFNNNGGPSNIKPTGTGISSIELSDGYVWKFMSTISLDDLAKFDVDNYIPVTDTPLQDSNQEIVMKAAVAGTIDTIKVDDGGLGYINPIINISGDGEGATAQAIMNGTSIDKIKILTPGKNYTHATITITSDEQPTSVASLRAIISPNEGHGYNIVKELYANRVMISADLEYDEGGKLPVTNDFRIITLLDNPTFREVELLDEEEEDEHINEVFSQLTKITLSGEYSELQEDDIITGLTSGAEAKIVSISADGTMLVNNVRGEFILSETIKCNNIQVTINSITLPDLIRDTGNFVYIDYRKPISRAEDQKEKIRVILQF